MYSYQLNPYMKASSTEILDELQKQGKLKEFFIPLFAAFGTSKIDFHAYDFQIVKKEDCYAAYTRYSRPGLGSYGPMIWLLTDHIFARLKHDTYTIESNTLREYMLQNLEGELLEKYKKSLVAYAEKASSVVKEEVLLPMKEKENKPAGNKTEKERDK